MTRNLLLTFLLLLPGQLRGSTVYTISAVVSPPASGIYTYTYELANDPSSTDNIFDFALFNLSGAVVPGSLTFPAGWGVAPSVNNIDWFSTDIPFDLQPGASLVFSLKSPDPPMVGGVSVLIGLDDTSGIPTDDRFDVTTGPVAGAAPSPAVPEPTNFTMLGTGILALCFVWRRRRRMTT